MEQSAESLREKKNQSNRSKNKIKLKRPFIGLLAFVIILFLSAVFGASYYYQKSVRANRELLSLRKQVKQANDEKNIVEKKLQESTQQGEVIARARIKKSSRIDPLEASLLEMESLPYSDEDDPRIINHGDRKKKKVAITIDDGWNADSRILKLMDYYDIKCTVFVIGGRNVAESHKTWLQKMDKAGFEICTHTYSHYIVTGLTDKELEKDIKKGQQVITKVTDKTVPFVRTCGGIYNERAVKVIDDMGYRLVQWDVELGDTFESSTTDSEVERVLKNVQNGSIILCHFGGYHTYEALKIIIPELQDRGYEITTVSDIVNNKKKD